MVNLPPGLLFSHSRICWACQSKVMGVQPAQLLLYRQLLGCMLQCFHAVAPRLCVCGRQCQQLHRMRVMHCFYGYGDAYLVGPVFC